MMKHRSIVRRVLVAASPASSTRIDYADAFEVCLAEPGSGSAEEFARATFAQMPPKLGAFVAFVQCVLLRLRLDPRRRPDTLVGWRIVRSEPDLLVLEADGPLAAGSMTIVRSDERHAVLTTRLHYRHRLLAGTIWAIVAPLHRGIVRGPLARVPATPAFS